MSRKLYEDGVLMSPCFAIKRFFGLRQKYGDKAALTKSEFKPEREAWIAGVFLLGLSELAHREFWLQINPEDSAPDIITDTFEKNKKGVTRLRQNLEIFEYESHAQTDVVGSISKKLEGKAYPDNFVLLCYVHGRKGEVLNTKTIFESLSKMKLEIGEVWVLASILGTQPEEHVIFQAYPTYNHHKYDYSKICKSSTQRELLQPQLGFSDGVVFKPLGKHIIKLP